jgi:hypothetical protein
LITTSVPEYEIEHLVHAMVPMRDGIRLSTDLFIPKGNANHSGPWPVLLTRTPYGNSDAQRAERLLYFARRGFACAFQDCRGRYDSEGEWEPFRSERNDGMDTIAWLAAQDFCNGSVGVTGGSYEGYCTWVVAYDRHPALKAICPIVPLPDPVINVPYQNGALFWNMVVWALMVHGRVNQNTGVANWKDLFLHLPLRTLDKAAGMESATWQNWCDHPALDDWWKEVCYMDKLGRVDIPALHICGWYDDDGISTYINYPKMRREAATAEARDAQMLVIGPWPHKVNVSSVVGEVDFGAGAVIDLNAIRLKFFAKYLAGEDHGLGGEPRCRIFLMGENRWHGFDDWPPTGAETKRLYLSSGGNANSLFGDGKLTTEAQRQGDVDAADCDLFTYDPANPVPYVTDPVALQLGEATDQQSIERRPDVLVYTTAPLEEDVVICGRVFAELYISTDVPATDFTAKLVDVWPNGRAIQLCDGIQRAEFRNSLESPEWLEPGKVYKVVVDMWATGIRFLRGHSIRLEVSSSAVPKFCRHLNTKEPQADATDWQVAHQVVWHTSEYPSAVVVEVVKPDVAD